jgi:hypothetical protein
MPNSWPHGRNDMDTDLNKLNQALREFAKARDWE